MAKPIRIVKFPSEGNYTYVFCLNPGWMKHGGEITSRIPLSRKIFGKIKEAPYTIAFYEYAGPALITSGKWGEILCHSFLLVLNQIMDSDFTITDVSFYEVKHFSEEVYQKLLETKGFKLHYMK